MNEQTSAIHHVFTSISTGLPGLDNVLQGVQPGDNIVWQVNSIDDYLPFVYPFCVEARQTGHGLIYFRFADHAALVQEELKADTYELHPQDGFEAFISGIFTVIEKYGVGACYVFDCLSELSADWYSDRMLGNFFMLTCPYLYTFETVAYFGLLRNRHMAIASNAIHTTAQVVIDVYRNRDALYVHPLKVYKRSSPDMYMVHRKEGDRFKPVTGSATIAEILTSVSQPWLDFTIPRLDVWTKTFAEAQQRLEMRKPGQAPDPGERELVERLLRMAVTRDARILELARRYLDLADCVTIGKRMIGTGLIGGKSVGMLVARAILMKSDPRWSSLLESHDSFFIGSDVFYTYLVQNKCWWVRRKLKMSGKILDGADDVRRRMLAGSFPPDIRNQFMEMLEYFGQSPIIVRSSSLLEDAYGNAFSGKYESVFCANQGSPQQRLERFTDAVRTVYASTMQNEALAYRVHRGLLDKDEQMAILVQRVSGGSHARFFFPHVAGVGFSFNPFAWNADIDSSAGMLRMVFGLGTRAVDRSDDDYTRIVALNAPMKRPETNPGEVRKYAQRRVDVLDLPANRHVTMPFDEIAAVSGDIPLEYLASRDQEMEQRAVERNMPEIFSWVLTFDRLLSDTGFVPTMREMLATLQQAYEYPVDIEFTANFLEDGSWKINLVQCRPFQIKGEMVHVERPGDIEQRNIILATKGPVIGTSLSGGIDRFIYIVPGSYSRLSIAARYAVARLIGRLNHLGCESRDKNLSIFLVGPGRWGTTSPSMGVPVSFSEINTVSVLCEIAVMHEGLIPDVSLGTHFFNDLVETDMTYLAVYPGRDGNVCNDRFFAGMPNHLAALLPDAAEWVETVKVIDSGTDMAGRRLLLYVNSLKQEGVCYYAPCI